MRLVLISLWFVFIASASFWLPAHEGDIGGEGPVLVPVYAVVAASTAIGVRRAAGSTREALLSTLPALAMVGLAALAGVAMNEQRDEFRGTPLYLWFGVALWASWGALVLSTALVSRTRWSGAAGIVIASIVALLGLIMFIARID